MTTNTTTPGPFKTEVEARETPAVRAVYDAFDADPGAGKMRAPNLGMLTAACDAAGVELGAFDQRILAWLATWEPQTCAVIAALIARAAAGSPAGAAGQREAEGLALARLRHAVAAWETARDAAEAACGDGTGRYRLLADRANAQARITAQDAAALLAEIGGAP